MSISEKFSNFQASKAVLFWSCAGCVVATVVVGFTWGGWVTGGSAQERAEAASTQAVAQLAAEVCFSRYLAAPDARVNLIALTEQSSYRRGGVLEEGGWVTFADREKPIGGAARICADRLAEVDPATLPQPAPVAAVEAAAETTTAQ
ncbi:hypothetical protein NIM87_06045 [Devosia sp. XJ19-1]|uniref:Uncharacterized protein n=1 Tax=Devosia ureilytica TaxID=2952754 RepID=A0A9Q4AM24_9HYPH|nr:hypothetical protein [Devosia ureilytica]MCP8883053.1 hypothetical protein [Devosia ureilytica]MCP8886579.1 hypothetical protein [Devosia ureilytica]